MRGGYLLDPFYVACVNDHPAGLWRMSELAPDSFCSSGFSISKHLHPCVASGYGAQIEEVGFIVARQPQVAVVYSLMRNLDKGAFGAAEMHDLQTLAPVFASVLELHCRMKYADCYTGIGSSLACGVSPCAPAG